MKKAKVMKYVLFIFICTYFLFLNNANSMTVWARGVSNDKITEDWGDLTGNETEFSTPYRIKFNSGNKWHDTYGNSWFYENLLSGESGGFWAYIRRNPKTATYSTDKYDYSSLLENTQKEYGKDAKHYVYSDNLNIKHGSNALNSKVWRSKGSMYIVNSKREVVEDNVEFRYLGYSSNGAYITNPYFPADRPQYTGDYWNNDWIKESWKEPWTMVLPSEYTELGGADPDTTMKTVLGWWEDVLKDPAHVGFKTVAQKAGKKTLRAQAEYWNERLMWLTNPKRGTGIVVGQYITDDGRTLYGTYVFPTENKANLRMTFLGIYEYDEETKEVGDRIAFLSRSENTWEVAVPKVSFKGDYDFDKVGASAYKVDTALEAGKKYYVKATVKNMTSEMPKNVTGDTLIDYWLLDSGIDPKRDYEMAKEGSVQSYNQPQGITYESKAYFEFEILVPANADDDNGYEFEVRGIVDDAYIIRGENYNSNDDSLSMIFDVEKKQEDMALSPNIQLFDQNGNSVKAPVAGQKYTAKFTVTKPVGAKTVGSNKASNPYTTIDASSNDGRGKQVQTIKATDKLYFKKSVTVVLDNIVPTTSYLEICGKISGVHKGLGYNDNPANDGEFCKVFAEENNFAVTDLDVSPGSVIRSKDEVAGRQDLVYI